MNAALLEQVYEDYAVDPSLARLRSQVRPLYPLEDNTDPMRVCVLADNEFLCNENDWQQVKEALAGYGPRLTHVMKFRDVLSARPEEWQAAKSLVSREIRLTSPEAWVAVGPLACELLGVQAWSHVVAAVDVARTPGGTLVVQGRWPNVRKVLDIFLDEDAGFARRG